MKLANGTGSIICLDKTGKKRRNPWTVRITTGWVDGKQQRKYLGYYKTQTDALLALAEYHKNGYDIDLTKLTLGEVYERWYKRIEPKTAKNVLNAHNMTYNRFDKLANVQIANIKADHLQDWMDNLDLKPGTKKRVKSTLSQVYKYAIKNDIISTNYAQYIEINEKTEKTGKIFTEEEIQLLWDNVDKPIVQWILILMYTGMRIGELLEITTDNMYLEDRYMIGGLKTEAGKDRVIPLHNKIIPLVKKQLNDTKHLIIDEKGRKLTYAKALREFVAQTTALGMEHKPHDTRKTAVSMMHTCGIPMETIRMIVGHSGKGITETTYLYKSPSELVEAINTIEIKHDVFCSL